MASKPVPLPPIAREARKMDVTQAGWLVAASLKNASKTDLAGLCRDRRVVIRQRAADALISLLVHDSTRDKDALKAWHDAMWSRPQRGIGSEDVAASFVPYGRDREAFIAMLEEVGVNGAWTWRWREHKYRNSVLRLAIEAANPDATSFLRIATTPTTEA